MEPEILFHPGRRFNDVTKEILSAFPYEPICFLDEGALRQQIQTIRDNFLPHSAYDDVRSVAYAVKANPFWYVLSVFADEGIRNYDCSSWHEIQEVRKVQPDARILFNHPIKRPMHIRQADAIGVRHFTAQDQDEVDTIIENASGESLEIAIRLKTLNSDASMNLSKKFGASHDDTIRLIDHVREKTAAHAGISIHAGSQNKNLKYFKQAIEQMMAIAQQTGRARTLNVGGGIPVSYHAGESFDTRAYLEIATKTLEQGLSKALNANGGSVFCEFGRAFVADMMTTVIPILKVYPRDSSLPHRQEVHFADGIYSSCIDAVLHPGWKYHFEALSKEGLPLTGDRVPSLVYGQTCDSGDKLPYNVSLPATLQKGDYLGMPKSGAYGAVGLASKFCGFEPPRVVIYNTDRQRVPAKEVPTDSTPELVPVLS